MTALDIQLQQIRILIEAAQAISGQAWSLGAGTVEEEASRQARQALVRGCVGVDLQYL